MISISLQIVILFCLLELLLDDLVLKYVVFFVLIGHHLSQFTL